MRCRLRGSDPLLGEALVRGHDDPAEISQDHLASLRLRVELRELRRRHELATPAEKRDRMTQLHEVQPRLLAFLNEHYQRAPHGGLYGKLPPTSGRPRPRGRSTSQPSPRR